MSYHNSCHSLGPGEGRGREGGKPMKFRVFSTLSIASPSATLYKIKIKTGDVLNAGTDADVYCCLYGDKGNTGQVEDCRCRF